MTYRTFLILIAFFAALIAPTAASALCLFGCPPSNSTVVSQLMAYTFRAMGQSLRVKSATFVDSQDANIGGVPIYQAMLDAEFVFADGSPLGTLQRVVVIYEKTNSGWVVGAVNCKICNLP
jgi:hypothetical protein